MRRPSIRTLALATLLASSGGAQVMAGATGGVTARLALWLLVTIAAAGAAGLLSGPIDHKKRPIQLPVIVSASKNLYVLAIALKYRKYAQNPEVSVGSRSAGVG
jgi:hypothetical protein